MTLRAPAPLRRDGLYRNSYGRDEMLEHDIHLPEAPRDGAPLLVLMHGRGADRQDLAGLRPFLPGGAILVLPQAPFPGAPWGYGPGWAWYRFLGENRPEPESFAASQRALGELLAALPGRLPVEPGELVLGGFSQGGTMALGHALANPGRVPRVVNLSGFLADHPDVRATPETVRGTRIFWGHGVQDPAIPFALAEAGRGALRAAGAALEARDYGIGHWIAQEELADLVDWLK